MFDKVWNLPINNNKLLLNSSKRYNLLNKNWLLSYYLFINWYLWITWYLNYFLLNISLHKMTFLYNNLFRYLFINRFLYLYNNCLMFFTITMLCIIYWFLNHNLSYFSNLNSLYISFLKLYKFEVFSFFYFYFFWYFRSSITFRKENLNLNF
jgi:hypothetical protein